MKIGNFSILQRHLGLMAFTAVLFVAVYFIGSTGVDNVGIRVDDYARWSDIDMVMNEEVNQTTLSLISSVRSYKAVSSEENYAALQQRMSNAREGLEGWLKMLADMPDLRAQGETVRPKLDSIGKVVTDFKGVQEERRAAVAEADAIVSGLIGELERLMEQLIDPAKEMAGLDADIPDMIRWGEIDMVMNEGVIAHALKLQTAIHDYAYELSSAKFKKLEEVLNSSREGLDEWAQVVKSEPDLEKAAAEVGKSYAALRGQMEKLSALSVKLVELDKQVDRAAADVTRTTSEIMEKVIDPAKEQNLNAAHDVKESTAARLLTVGLIAMALLLVASVSLAMFESGILKRLISNADMIAKGDFSVDARLDQADELGQISHALERIKESVGAALEENDSIIREAEYGKFAARGDSSSFQGAYAELIEGSNSLMNIFETLINRLPVGVLARSLDRDLLYVNDMIKVVAGSDKLIGCKCNDIFNTEDCEHNCASDRSLETGKVENSETTCHLENSDHEIAYTAIPMMTRAGEKVAVLEIIVDQTKIKQTNQVMLEAAREAENIADRLASASDELSAQVEQVAAGSETQRQRIGETATAMEQMSATVLEVARNASKATEQSDSARGKAEEGAELVGRVVSGINQVNTVALSLQENIDVLGRRAEAIGGILSMITDIADQTNLLALNAAIEAARAGEAGRGFAVVADEVRKLAEKTVSATDEVGSSIREIQAATDRSIRDVNDAVKTVADVNELANESGSALSQIVEVSAESSVVISSIATAAEEQSATAEQINRAVEDVNLVASENADGMAQSASAVHELAGMAGNLKKVLDKLKSVDS